MVAHTVSRNLVTDNADNAVDHANVYISAVQFVALLNVILEIAVIFADVLFGSADVVRSTVKSGELFGIARLIRIQHPGNSAAAKGTTQDT